MIPLELTRWQRLRLQRQLHQARDTHVYRRTLAVLQFSSGQPIAAIAETLRVSRQSVYNWIGAYAQSRDPTALFDDDRPGRPTLWTEDLQALLRSLLGRSPDQLGYFAVNWTVPLLQEHLRRCAGRRLSDDTVRRQLDHLGYVWKRSRYVLDPDPERDKKTPHPQPRAGPAAAQRRPG
jgi:transposase